jgi:hypothetical protein
MLTPACPAAPSHSPRPQVYKSGVKVDQLVGTNKDKLAALVAKYK